MFKSRVVDPAAAFAASFFALSPDAMYVTQDGIIVHCNPACERVLGHSTASIIGQGPGHLSMERQPDGQLSADLVPQIMNEVLEKGLKRFEWVNRGADGLPRPLLVTVLAPEGFERPTLLAILQSHDAVTQLVDQVGARLGALAQGDLSTMLTAPLAQEYEPLRHNLNHSLSHLRDIVGAVIESSTRLSGGAQEINQAAQDLAHRTEVAAASLERAAGSIGQMDQRLQTSVDASQQTVARADQAIATVAQGRSVADQVVQAMTRVSDSAKGIDDVIEGLDKIAFQTRVLAMNAAVEAGRAGDAGRGFAVVADLVSALAMRAEEEAKRAREQLTVTQSEIVTAVDAVQQVDGALAAISSDVGQVHHLLGTMAADHQEQSAAISQIASAVAGLDRSTQQNAAMVEQTSAAARTLSVEANDLAGRAGFFRLKEGQAVTERAVRDLALT